MPPGQVWELKSLKSLRPVREAPWGLAFQKLQNSTCHCRPFRWDRKREEHRTGQRGYSWAPIET